MQETDFFFMIHTAQYFIHCAILHNSTKMYFINGDKYSASQQECLFYFSIQSTPTYADNVLYHYSRKASETSEDAPNAPLSSSVISIFSDS